MLAQCPVVERELDIDTSRKSFLQRIQFLFSKAFLTQRFTVDIRTSVQRGMAFCISYNLRDFILRITQIAKSQRYSLVDDFEVSATCEFFNLHQGKIGLNSCCITIHHQSDGSGGSYTGNLCISVTVALAQFNSGIGFLSCSPQQIFGADLFINTHRLDGQAFILFIRSVVSRPSVVSKNPKHVLLVSFIRLECTQLACKFST